VNSAAIAAATAAIRDAAHVQKSVEHNETWLPHVAQELTALGLTVTPSVGNFVLVHFPDDPAQSAEKADAFLIARGFVARRVTGYGFPNALRLTIGSEEANQGVLAALAAFLGKA
jgi:histidinol-phosphate aminotransferase